MTLHPDLFDITEADETASSVEQALENLRHQIHRGESAGIVDMYERAAWRVGATVAQTEAVLREQKGTSST